MGIFTVPVDLETRQSELEFRWHDLHCTTRVIDTSYKIQWTSAARVYTKYGKTNHIRNTVKTGGKIISVKPVQPVLCRQAYPF